MSPSPANTNVNSDTKQKSSNVERDILSFVNENPRSVDFCRIIEEEYMTIARNNNETTQSNPRHDVRLQIIHASISLGNLRDRSQPDSLAKLPEPLPGQGADSRMVRGHMQEQSAGKKRRASASVAIQEDRDAIRRAKVRETSQKHRAKRAQQIEDLKMRKEALEAALALLKSAGSSG